MKKGFRYSRLNAPKGALYEESLRLQLSLSLKLFEELTKAWSEFATIGKRLMRASMNSRGALGL